MHDVSAAGISTLIEEWPEWNLPEKPVLIRELKGGLTNRNVLLQSGSEKLVLRVNHPHGQAIGADRERELQVHDTISFLDITPNVRFTSSDRRYMLRDYVDGQTLEKETLTRSDLNAIKSTLDRVHACDPRTWRDTCPNMSELQVADSCLAYLSAGDQDQKNEDRQTSDSLKRQIEAIHPLPDHEKTLCHLDPLPSNWVKDEHGKLWLIDWEYAALAHPLLDFAALYRHLPEHLKGHWDRLHEDAPASLKQEALRQMALLEETWCFAQR